MKTKIINYRGGSKGDFIINFLNNKISFRTLGQSASSAGTDTRSFGQSLLDHQMHQYVDLMLKTNYKESFVSSHSLTKLSVDLLQSLSTKYDLYHIVVEQGWQRQVNIDFSFKALSKEIHPSLVARERNKKIMSEHDINNLKYNIDIFLPSRNLSMNDDNRIKVMLEMIELIHDDKNTCDLINHISYDSLFVEPFSDARELADSIGKKFDERFYKGLVKKSFLPKQVSAFGETFDVENLGYRYYI